MNLKKNTQKLSFVFLFSGILIAINIVRIIKVSITHDETGYDPTGSYSNIIKFTPVTANNHILHNILRKFFIETFSYNPFFTRFDNLLAQVVFLLFSYLLCKRLFNRSIWQLCGFVFLNLQPFMFEFWGLSRGYGLALAFMAPAVYYMLQYLQSQKLTYISLSLLSSVFAVYSNFTLLNFYCGLIGTIVILKLLLKNKNFIKNFLKNEFPPIALSMCLLYFLIAGPIRLLRINNQLYYGGDLNIFNDTIVTLVANNLYNINSLAVLVTSCIVLVTPVIAGIYWLIKILKRKVDEQLLVGLMLWLLLIIPALSTIVQYYTMQTKYLIDRTALFFIPLYILQFIFWLYSLKLKKTGLYILLLVTGLGILNFLRNINLTSTLTWWHNAYDLTTLERIIDESKNDIHKPKVCVTSLSYPPILFYVYTKYHNALDTLVQVVSSPGDDTIYDYYYLPTDQTHNLSKRYVVDTSYFGGTFLLLGKK